MSEIVVGSRVRSFDFYRNQDLTGERACYVDGTVTAIGWMDGFPDCPRYEIRVERIVFGGEDIALNRDSRTHVYPPVNGTKSLMSGDLTDGVVLLDSGRPGGDHVLLEDAEPIEGGHDDPVMCEVCGAVEDLETAMDGDWVPHWWDIAERGHGPTCGDCCRRLGIGWAPGEDPAMVR